jgi:hypothetical protein
MISAPIFEPARVWLRRQTLDRNLAHGADPSTTPELSRRARQLTSRRRRNSLARAIRNLIQAAEDPRHPYSAAAPLQRREILSERGFLLELADDLAGDDELGARGIALVERLLTDGTSPVYGPSPDGTLHTALVHARATLYLA